MQTEELERARRLVLHHGWNAMAYQILNPGIRHWFAPRGTGVVGYVHAGGFHVVAGAPVCTGEDLVAVADAFTADARASGERVCFFGAEGRLLDRLAARGPTTVLPLGAQPVWNPQGWPAIFLRKASLRAQLARARNKGVAVERWDPARAQDHPALRRCPGEWLQSRGLPPMHFLVEWDVLAHVLDRRVYVASRGGDIVGYARPPPRGLAGGAGRPRRRRAQRDGRAPSRRRGAGGGGRGCSLPHPRARLAHPGTPPAPLPVPVQLLLGWVRVHGRRFYNFEGLEAFKRKFEPDVWEPIYAVAEGAGQELRMLYAIAGAFGGRSPVGFLGHAMVRAVRQEARWVQQRLRQRLHHDALPMPTSPQ